MTADAETARVRDAYDRYADRYDRETVWYDRVMLGDGRSWVCSRARGRVLEVAVGTGLTLPHYPAGTDLVGVDLSLAMLHRARDRRVSARVRLVEADATRLPFGAATFDTVVCTLGLSSIPDDRAAVSEMARVLRDGGSLVLLGHVAADRPLARIAQRLLQRLADTRAPDTQARQVVPHLAAAGLTVQSRRTTRGGMIERVVATKGETPAAAPPPPPGARS